MDARRARLPALFAALPMLTYPSRAPLRFSRSSPGTEPRGRAIGPSPVAGFVATGGCPACPAGERESRQPVGTYCDSRTTWTSSSSEAGCLAARGCTLAQADSGHGGESAVSGCKAPRQCLLALLHAGIGRLSGGRRGRRRSCRRCGARGGGGAGCWSCRRSGHRGGERCRHRRRRRNRWGGGVGCCRCDRRSGNPRGCGGGTGSRWGGFRRGSPRLRGLRLRH